MRPENRDEKQFLLDIQAAIGDVKEFTKGGVGEFMRTKMIQDAVIRNLEIVGEAVRNLKPVTRELAHQIPWRQISGTRDRLAHGYYNVDLNIVWDIVENHLGPLDDAVREILAK